MRKKREFPYIVILSDSLGFPRSEPEKVSMEECYPSLLANKFGKVLFVGYGAATSENIAYQTSYFRGNQKKIYLLHFGIVDCTPRVLTKYESCILKKIKIKLPQTICMWLRKARLTRKTNPLAFRHNCKKIKENLSGNLIVLPIAKASKKFENKVPGIQKSVHEYNKILKSEFSKAYLNVSIDPNKNIMSDFHHLNKLGHKKIFKAVQKRILIINRSNN